MLACILAILAFERLDDVIAAVFSAALTLVGVIASYDACQAHGLGPSALALPAEG